MKASPIQLSICVTCVLLLLAKLWDWWQGLAAASLPEPLAPGAPLTVAQATAGFAVVPSTTPPPAPAAATFPSSDDAGDELGSFEFGAAVPTAPAPSTDSSPVRPDFASHPARPVTRLAGPEPAEEASDLQRQLADLAGRELSAARLRGKSMLLNAETQARAITEEAERTSAARIEKFNQTAVRPPAVEQNEARRQGAGEGHAIGLRKGEIEALGQIEQVFGQIEAMLEVPAPAGGSGGSRR